jgi:hypothetical protein
MVQAQKFKPAPVLNSSLGLQALCQRLQNVTTCDILELGPVRNENIEFWSRFRPSIYVADLRSLLPLPVSVPEDADSEFIDPNWESLLGLPPERRYDIILVWDLLNYLDLQTVASLIRYLRQFCRRGTILFTLIFDQKQMPSEITVYGIKDESHLKYEFAGSEMKACPRHQPRALSLAMARFQTSESFRLKNGIIEYLFEYEGNIQGSPNA